MAETTSRYTELKKVVESLATIDVEAKTLPQTIKRLRRRAERALKFKQVVRNDNLEGARAAAAIVTKEKADAFRASVEPAIAAAREGGAKTVRQIADALNAAGVRTSRGGAWTPGTLHRFLDGN